MILQDRPFRRVQPTARELLVRLRDSEGLTKRNRLDWADDLAARVERVLALHQPGLHHEDSCPVCDEFDYPCATVRILNGEEP